MAIDASYMLPYCQQFPPTRMQLRVAQPTENSTQSSCPFAGFTVPWYTSAKYGQPLKQQTKDFIRTVAAAGLSTLGVTALRRRQQAADPRVTILTYHGISASNFERHLQWLTTHYRIVSLGEAVQWISGNGRDEGRRVVLTFDDGYKSFHRDLWPLLRKYCTPATLFAVSHFVGTDRLLWWDLIEVMLTKANMQSVEVWGRRWACNCDILVAHAKTLLENDKLRWIEDLRVALAIALPASIGTPFELCTWHGMSYASWLLTRWLQSAGIPARTRYLRVCQTILPGARLPKVGEYYRTNCSYR